MHIVLTILFSTETKAPLGACADNVENNSFKLLIAPGVVFHDQIPTARDSACDAVKPRLLHQIPSEL